jgi:hypothetical protein
MMSMMDGGGDMEGMKGAGGAGGMTGMGGMMGGMMGMRKGLGGGFMEQRTNPLGMLGDLGEKAFGLGYGDGGNPVVPNFWEV